MRLSCFVVTAALVVAGGEARASNAAVVGPITTSTTFRSLQFAAPPKDGAGNTIANYTNADLAPPFNATPFFRLGAASTVIRAFGIAQVDLNAQLSSAPGGMALDFGGSSEISIPFKPIGPDGPVSVYIKANMHILSDTPFASAGTYYEIRTIAGDLVYSDRLDCGPTASLSCNEGAARAFIERAEYGPGTDDLRLQILRGDTLDGVGRFVLDTRNQYTFTARASANLIVRNPLNGQLNFDGAAIQAFADPYIYIGPDQIDRDLYGISVADGFLNLESIGVPEPTTWALLILGFGATGALARRRKLPATSQS